MKAHAEQLFFNLRVRALFLLLLGIHLAIPASADIQYYGFWGSAMNGAGSGDYINASAAHASNTVMIGDVNATSVRSKLLEAVLLNQTAVLMVQNVFFPGSSSALYSDYQ